MTYFDDLKIKVLSSSRCTMFLFFNTIFVTSEFLTVVSDKCLDAAIMHELGHKHQFKLMLGICIINLLVFFQLVLFFGLAFFLLPLVYLLFCWYSRLGEYHADVYALRHTTVEGVLELLDGEGSRLDSKWSMFFYPLRFHPDKCRRIRNIMNEV